MEPSSAPWRVIDSTEPEPPSSESPPRGRPWLAIGAAILAVAVAAFALLLAGRPGPSVGIDGAASLGAGTVDEGGSSSSSSVPASRTLLVVEVGGAVARPGVYRLAAGSRIGDAIEAAGGYGARVDAAAADRALNLAAPLKDGDEVHVPSRDDARASGGPDGAATGSGGGGAGSGPGGLVDLNRATAAELDALPGIGPATAAKIIAAREQQPFAAVDDLGSRKVLGSATLAKIRDLVTVGR